MQATVRCCFSLRGAQVARRLTRVTTESVLSSSQESSDGMTRGQGHVSAPGNVSQAEREPVPGAHTATGAQKEHFGHGHEALVEAGHKGAEISAGRPEEARKEAARKAARTRAERYGQTLHVSDPAQDELMEKDTSAQPTGASGEHASHQGGKTGGKHATPAAHPPEEHAAAARSQAAHKGGAGSVGRSEEARKEAARKAARTRAERYDPQKDELMSERFTGAARKEE